MPIFTKLKEYSDAIDTAHKVAATAFAAAMVAAGFLTGSHQLAIIIAATVLSASISSFFITVWQYRDSHRDRCLRARRWYLAGAFAGVILALSVLLLATPSVARLGEFAIRIFEFLMRAMLLLNFLVAFGMFVFIFAAIAVVVLSALCPAAHPAERNA